MMNRVVMMHRHHRHIPCERVCATVVRVVLVSFENTNEMGKFDYLIVVDFQVRRVALPKAAQESSSEFSDGREWVGCCHSGGTLVVRGRSAPPEPPLPPPHTLNAFRHTGCR